MAKQTDIRLTEPQANALSRLLFERLYGTTAEPKPARFRGKPRIFRDILDQLDNAVFQED
jgi:hypothetical protein